MKKNVEKEVAPSRRKKSKVEPDKQEWRVITNPPASLSGEKLFSYLITGERRERAENGDSHALFDAIEYCARCNIAMPAWLAELYIAGWGKILKLEEMTLDAAFGKPFKNKAHFNKLRKSQKRDLLVYSEVNKAHYKRVRSKTSRQGEGDIHTTFEEVGKKLKLSSGTVSTIFYEVRDFFNEAFNAHEKARTKHQKITKKKPKQIERHG